LLISFYKVFRILDRVREEVPEVELDEEGGQRLRYDADLKARRACLFDVISEGRRWYYEV
jgi:hypothetical protein